ncbi:hypothetical protein JRQ81_006562 [Phrynocephalus forsythii]|uniref:Uncharacterized protein n=1 Tax=Phrynocephalus forsythii TaxID=171643 RepID=A0A9Q1B6H2_9SAUR|nr:hypothetical protein JRQ81_006562 [Phrynocephalus forsythii]
MKLGSHHVLKGPLSWGSKSRQEPPEREEEEEEEEEEGAQNAVKLRASGGSGRADLRSLGAITGSDSQLLHWFEKKDVDDVKVHTQYEISVQQRFIGKPDITYRLLSAKTPEVIPILEMQLSKKIQFLEDALGFVRSEKTHQEEVGTSI